MRYLSDEWLAAASDAVSDVEPLATPLTIEFLVIGEGGDEQRHALQLGPAPVSFHRETSQAGVRLILERDVAAAIANGDRSAQRAFLDGAIRVGGDVRLLLGHERLLADVDDRLASLRADTDFA